MKNLTRIFLVVLCIFASRHQSNSQIVYSRWASPGGHISYTRVPNFLCTGLTCVIPGNLNNAASTSLTDHATIAFPVLSLLASITITMDLEATVTSGHAGGVYLVSNSDLASLSVFPTYTIELLDASNNVVGTETQSSLLYLHLLSSTGVFLCAAPSALQSYNKVRLTISVPVGVGVPLDFDLYYAYGNNPNTCSNAVLPVTLSGFDLKADNDCNVKINWTTEDEINSAHFIVQRNEPGENNWPAIATIDATANMGSRKNYTYTDITAESGAWQYRLVAVDMDGRSRIYPARNIILDCRNAYSRLYPSITNTEATVLLPGNMKNPTISLVNISGKLQQVPIHGTGSLRKIDVQQLPAGLYIVRIADRTKVESLKLIVRR